MAHFNHVAPFELQRAVALSPIKAVIVSRNIATHLPADVFKPGQTITLVFKKDWAHGQAPEFYGQWVVTSGEVDPQVETGGGIKVLTLTYPKEWTPYIGGFYTVILVP
jgi:hypothetical protein